jgi:hypothetical protein
MQSEILAMKCVMNMNYYNSHLYRYASNGLESFRFILPCERNKLYVQIQNAKYFFDCPQGIAVLFVKGIVLRDGCRGKALEW